MGQLGMAILPLPTQVIAGQLNSANSPQKQLAAASWKQSQAGGQTGEQVSGRAQSVGGDQELSTGSFPQAPLEATAAPTLNSGLFSSGSGVWAIKGGGGGKGKWPQFQMAWSLVQWHQWQGCVEMGIPWLLPLLSPLFTHLPTHTVPPPMRSPWGSPWPAPLLCTLPTYSLTCSPTQLPLWLAVVQRLDGGELAEAWR